MIGTCDKILDPDLASFAASDGAAAKRSVIVEVDVPGTYAAPRAPAKKLVKRGSAKSASEDKYATAAGKAMAKAEALLADLGLLASSVKLPSAASFVVDAGAGDLRALCESPLVSVIRPNRTHRVSAQGLK